MKIIQQLYLALLLVSTTQAQLTAVLNVQSNPPSILSSWASTPQVVTLIVNNATQNVQSYKIKTTLKSTSGEVLATTDLSKVPTLTSANASSMVYNAATVLPLEYISFTGIVRSSMQRSGKLPSESYQLCIQLVNPIDFGAITQEQCKMFSIANLQLPFVVNPAPQAMLPITAASTAITFRWTPLVPKPKQSIISYRIQVFEVLQGQQPMQAFRANLPLLDHSVLNTTQYIWQPQLSFISQPLVVTIGDSSTTTPTAIVHTFIWTIQTLLQNPITGTNTPATEGSPNGDGRSEPQVFYIVKPSMATPTHK